MTRIFTDGAEMGDCEFWDVKSYHMAAVDDPVPIGGTYSYRGAWLGAFKVIDGLSEFYMRYRVRTNNVSEISGAEILGWRYDTQLAMAISIDNLKRFAVEVSSAYPASAPVVMQNDTWYLLEVHIVIAAGGGGRVELFIDGVQYIDYAGNTDPYNHGVIDNVYFNSNAYTEIYIDDLALNSTAGVVDNSWCGDGMIVKMIPNGDGDDNDWTNSNGDSVNNYSYVDEFPNDGDLTYVYCDGSASGTQDDYALTDLDFTNKTVLRIYPEARARATSAYGYTLKLGIIPSGDVPHLSAARNLLVDYYSRIVGDEYLENPFDSNPWDELSLDPLQFVAEVG